MKFCSKCTQANPDDAAFCSQCGTVFEDTVFEKEVSAVSPAPVLESDETRLWRAFYWTSESHSAVSEKRVVVGAARRLLPPAVQEILSRGHLTIRPYVALACLPRGSFSLVPLPQDVLVCGDLCLGSRSFGLSHG